MSVGSGWRVALVAVGLAGCAAVHLQTTDAEMEAADRDAAAGREREANTRYEAIVKDHPSDPNAAEALHRMAMLRVEPGGPLRDRRAAQVLFRRLADEYGSTLPGREARAWRTLLGQIDRCEAEAARRGADVEKLRQTLESIKDSDLELEQRP